MNVLILGASARAAAHSAIRAGLSPSAIDLFGDVDLRAVCPAVRVPAAEYPEALFRAADDMPPGPWLYTGGLENRPDLVDALAERRPLWGVSGESLRRVRDPLAVSEALRAAGLPSPAVAVEPPAAAGDHAWLEKPLASSGGTGILPASPDPARRTDRARASYYQQWVAGVPASAVFVGDGATAVLAGITRQFVGRPGAEFGYRGTLAPWPVSSETEHQIEAIGRAIGGHFGLAGLFGVDLILDEGGRAWTVEVNPRYTASVEVLELAGGIAWLATHREACEGGAVEARPRSKTCRGFVAKEIVYASQSARFQIGPDDTAFAPQGRGDLGAPAAADLPENGTRFEAGDPVATVFGHGPTLAECLRRLNASARELRRRLLPVPREERGSFGE